MPGPTRKTQQPKISNEAVLKATGKSWNQWFHELDEAGASAWPHKQIAKHVNEGYLATFWWAQSIAVAYENARGLREKHEMPDGYQIQREKRMAASVAKTWQAWTDPNQRKKWLPESAAATIRQVREDKHTIRLDWPDGSRVLAGVRPLGDSRSVCGVQQSKLPDAAAAETAKAFWADRLTQLKQILE